MNALYGFVIAVLMVVGAFFISFTIAFFSVGGELRYVDDQYLSMWCAVGHK